MCSSLWTVLKFIIWQISYQCLSLFIRKLAPIRKVIKKLPCLRRHVTPPLFKLSQINSFFFQDVQSQIRNCIFLSASTWKHKNIEKVEVQTKTWLEIIKRSMSEQTTLICVINPLKCRITVIEHFRIFDDFHLGLIFQPSSNSRQIWVFTSIN